MEVQLDTAEAVLQPEEGPAGEGTNHGTAPPWQVESSSPLVLAYGVQGRIALPPSNKGDGGLLENARAVYGEMSTEILVRFRCIQTRQTECMVGICIYAFRIYVKRSSHSVPSHRTAAVPRDRSLMLFS